MSDNKNVRNVESKERQAQVRTRAPEPLRMLNIPKYIIQTHTIMRRGDTSTKRAPKLFLFADFSFPSYFLALQSDFSTANWS